VTPNARQQNKPDRGDGGRSPRGGARSVVQEQRTEYRGKTTNSPVMNPVLDEDVRSNPSVWNT
jgi:hypothetical protein